MTAVLAVTAGTITGQGLAGLAVLAVLEGSGKMASWLGGSLARWLVGWIA